MDQKTFDIFLDNKPPIHASALNKTDAVTEFLQEIVRDTGCFKGAERIGDIRIVDVCKSKQTEELRYDPAVRKVFTIYDLKDVLSAKKFAFIMIPNTAAIDRCAVSEICEYYRCTKTIIFEYSS